MTFPSNELQVICLLISLQYIEQTRFFGLESVKHAISSVYSWAGGPNDSNLKSTKEIEEEKIGYQENTAKEESNLEIQGMISLV